MLTPRKHLDLDVSVLRVSALMLRELSKMGVVEFVRLRQFVLRRAGPNGERACLPALNFLFLMGKAEYHLKNDTIEFKLD
jgi:hypothetical protein